MQSTIYGACFISGIFIHVLHKPMMWFWRILRWHKMLFVIR